MANRDQDQPPLLPLPETMASLSGPEGGDAQPSSLPEATPPPLPPAEASRAAAPPAARKEPPPLPAPGASLVPRPSETEAQKPKPPSLPSVPRAEEPESEGGLTPTRPETPLETPAPPPSAAPPPMPTPIPSVERAAPPAMPSPTPIPPRVTDRRMDTRRWMVAGAVALVVVLAGALMLWLATRPPKTPDLKRMVTASPGQLLVDVNPWAEVVGMHDATGQALALPTDPYTPLILSLPPGRYSIELAHPDLGAGTRRCVVELSETEPATCRLNMTDVDGAQYLKEAGW